MKKKLFFGVIGLLIFFIPGVLGGAVDISPDILYANMPVTITYSDFQDGEWIDMAFQPTYMPDTPEFTGAMVGMSMPFNLSHVYLSSIDGNYTDDSFDFLSESYAYNSINEGTFLFDLIKNNATPGEKTTVSYILEGEKESGDNDGTISLFPDFNPPQGVLNVLVSIEGEEWSKDIPYMQNVTAPSAEVEYVTVESGKTATGNFTLSHLNNGLSYCYANITIEDDSIGEFEVGGVTLYDGFTGGNVSYPYYTELYATASPNITGPIDEIPVAQFTYEGITPGSTLVHVTEIEIYDVNGALYPTVEKYPGLLSVTAPPVPGSDFIGNPLKGIIPFNVTFDYVAPDIPTSFNWSFGDGTPNATVKNPTHTYWNPGTYDVGLTVAGPTGNNTTVKSGYIEAKQVALWFMSNPTSGTAPLMVTFNGTASVPSTNWQYYFGDGLSGAGPNTTHVYNEAGTYTVKATADISGAKNSAIRYNYIKVT